MSALMRGAAGLLLAYVACSAAVAADPAKVLRIAQFEIDTLDPQQYTDDPSFQVVQALFEPLYEWDYLSPTPKLTPLTAIGPPEVTDDGRVWTFRLKRGVLFNDDPAFKGKPRELTADDYVYSYKRWLDPNGRARRQSRPDRSHHRRAAGGGGRQEDGKFNFDTPIEGLRAIDRYTVQIRMSAPDYPNIRDLLGFVGAAAREVVEAAGGDIRARPVGTGPYRAQGVEARLAAHPRGESGITARPTSPRAIARRTPSSCAA